MNDLVPIENDKPDAYSRILRFYQKSDIVLTAGEEEILKRWDYADKLMQMRQYKMPDIIEKIRTRFSVSPFTAQGDIRNAQALFGATRLLNKNYLLAQHLENIQLKIKQFETDKSCVQFLPKLYEVERRAILALQDAPRQDDEPAPVIIFGVAPGPDRPVAAGVLTFEQAKELINLKKQKPSVEDIDYEDVK